MVGVLASYVCVAAAWVVSGQTSPPATRIVSLLPAATQTLFAIGAGDRLVGVSSFDDWPPAVRELPRVGALLDPDLETILTLRPDLVIIDPALGVLVKQLEAAGIDSYPYATAGVEEALRHMVGLGRMVGMERQGRVAADRLRTELETVQLASANLPAPAVMLVFGRRPGAFAELWVSGGKGFLHELILIAGGRNLYADIEQPGVKASMEMLLTRVPDVVLEVRVGNAVAPEPGTITGEWRSLPGFERVRVALITDSWILLPGPRMGEAAELLAASIRSGSEREQDWHQQ